MLDVGFSEVLLISVIALVVLGPEKLPRLASQIGRWVGRARAMARQFREQLEQEVNLEEERRTFEAKKPANSVTQAGDQSVGASARTAAVAGQQAYESSQSADTQSTQEPQGASPQDAPSQGTQSTSDTPIGPDPVDFRADTFSHAHPTNEYGANPYTSNGAAESKPSPSEADVAPTQLELAPVNATQPQRTSSGEAYAPSPTHTPADVAADPTTQSDNSGADRHGHA